MRHIGNRTIKVNKNDLIVQIEKNKRNHIKEFEKAKVAFREEALRQLRTQLEKIEEGALEVKLDLVNPVDNSENYDKILEMFKWDVREEVELEQNEFLEYVQDETDFAMQAKMSNAYYVGR